MSSIFINYSFSWDIFYPIYLFKNRNSNAFILLSLQKYDKNSFILSLIYNKNLTLLLISIEPMPYSISLILFAFMHSSNTILLKLYIVLPILLSADSINAFNIFNPTILFAKKPF